MCFVRTGHIRIITRRAKLIAYRIYSEKLHRIKKDNTGPCASAQLQEAESGHSARPGLVSAAWVRPAPGAAWGVAAPARPSLWAVLSSCDVAA